MTSAGFSDKGSVFDSDESGIEADRISTENMTGRPFSEYPEALETVSNCLFRDQKERDRNRLQGEWCVC